MEIPVAAVHFLGVFPRFTAEVYTFVKIVTEKARLTRPFELKNNFHGLKSGAFESPYHNPSGVPLTFCGDSLVEPGVEIARFHPGRNSTQIGGTEKHVTSQSEPSSGKCEV